MNEIDYTQWEFDRKTLGYKKPRTALPQNPPFGQALNSKQASSNDLGDGFYIMKGSEIKALPQGFKGYKALPSSQADNEENDQTQSEAELIYSASKSGTNKLPRGQKIFFGSVISICLLIAVSLSILMSQGLNLGHVIGKLFRVDTEPQRYYAVITSTHATKEEAQASALTIKQQGGAGYIIFDEHYLVAAALYPDEQSAKKVAEQIDGYDAIVHTVSINAAKLDVTDKAAARAAKEILGVFDNTYSQLYQTAIALDKGEMTTSAALEKINSLIVQNKEKATAFKAATESQSKILQIRITSALGNMENKLSALAMSAGDTVNLSTSIKYACFEIIFDYAALNSELNALR